MSEEGIVRRQQNLTPIDSPERARELARKRNEKFRSAVIAGIKRGAGTNTASEAVALMAEQLTKRVLNNDDKSHVIFKVLANYAGYIPDKMYDNVETTMGDNRAVYQTFVLINLYKKIENELRERGYSGGMENIIDSFLTSTHESGK